jgi:uncharacterized protein (DUF2141 family)
MMLLRLTLGSLFLSLSLWAGDLTVTVSGIDSDKGEVGCALFRGADGFPMDSAKAESQWIKAKTGTVECKFANVGAGDYAVSASHDLNGNRKTDTNFVGMPKEPWGVSNDARPKFRAPRFEEARFTVKPGDSTPRVEVRLAR